MQIGTVTNQYINNYHNTASVQTYNAQQVRQVQDMSETRLMEYHQEQYREQQRWLAYILMMQFFAKENMWSLLNQMRIHRTSRHRIYTTCPENLNSCMFEENSPSRIYTRKIGRSQSCPFS